MTTVNAAMRARNRLRDIQENYPYRALLPDWVCTDENFEVLNTFCEALTGEPPKTRTVGCQWSLGEESVRVYHFRTQDQADAFARHFDAELLTLPVSKNGHIYREDAWSHRINYGPISAPQWLRRNP